MLAWALLIASLSYQTQFIKDSTVFYTLKENEVMVKMTEHQFMHFSRKAVYIFATYTRDVGYFVRTSQGKSFGPFTDLDDAYARSGYWTGYRGPRAFVLNVLEGQETGPFNLDNDPNYTFNDYQSTINRDSVFLKAESAVVAGTYCINLNGKLIKTRYAVKDSMEFQVTDLTRRPDGWYVYYRYGKSFGFYGYPLDSTCVLKQKNITMTEPKISNERSDSLFVDGKFYAKADRMFLGPEGEFVYSYDAGSKSIFYSKREGDSAVIYRNKVPIIKRRYHYSRENINIHWPVISVGDDVYHLGKFYARPERILEGSLKEGFYYDAGSKSIFHTQRDGDSTVIFQNKVPIIKRPFNYASHYVSIEWPIISSGNDTYLLKARKLLHVDSWTTFFSNSQTEYANDEMGNMLINGVKAGYGYHLAHDERKDSFVWISVSGRNLYLNEHVCKN